MHKKRISCVIKIGLLIVLFFLIGCAPMVNNSRVIEKRSPKSSNSPIIVYDVNQEPPENSKVIGNYSISVNGYTVGHDFMFQLVNTTKDYARSIGGEGVKITDKSKMMAIMSLKSDILIFDSFSNDLKISYPKSETEFRNYYDLNVDKLDEIEGIWSYQVNSKIVYRIAIIKDSLDIKYDYCAIILESQFPQWKLGSIKAKFRKTSYSKVFETKWYNADFSENKLNYIIDDIGLLKILNDTKDNYALKQYPIYDTNKQKNKIGISEDIKQSSGSGTLISETGLIVTNFHVIDNSSEIEVYFPQINKEYIADIVLKDKNNDLAILRLREFNFSETFSKSIPFIVSTSSSSKLGEDVFTLGFPLGEILGKSSKFSSGKINSLFGIQDDPRVYQVSNPIQPGNSGGPLFNSGGEFIGIVFSSLNAKFFYENADIIPQNVNFAIKSNYLLNLISLLPDEIEISNRKNSLSGLPIEKQIELIQPFIVNVKTK